MMVVSDASGRSSVAQGVIDLQDEGVDCTVRSVEEFRASGKQETVAKYLSDGWVLVAHECDLKVAILFGRRG
jgi:hypothetical protein